MKPACSAIKKLASLPPAITADLAIRSGWQRRTEEQLAMAHIRDASPADFPALLALNAESVHFLSPMDLQRLQQLFAQAAYCRVIEQAGQVVAFLLAFREAADYDSPNYRWFAERYPQFLYIDRIVVAGSSRGLGCGAMLYADLFAFARQHAIARITCEFDVEPPNEASRRFHARFGFHEVGKQWLGNGGKQVSLQEATSEVINTVAADDKENRKAYERGSNDCHQPRRTQQ